MWDFCCSIAQSCLTLRVPVSCSMGEFPVLHHLLEHAQTMSIEPNAIKKSLSLSSPSPHAFSPSKHQSLF